ncbi:MAG TPA: hypothetical protein VLS96_00745 [Nodosilinea sp.]|nr:hypothetical protein [Nodosilinea sp.]
MNTSVTPYRHRLQHRLWLGLMLVGAGLAIALPGQAGSAPVGVTSGVNVGGSTILPSGASSLGSEEQLELTSPNATFDPATGQIILTAAAQTALNQAAVALLQSLQSSNPSLIVTLTSSITIDLTSPSPVGATGEGGEGLIGEIAEAVAAAIAAGNSVTLTSSQGTLTIAPPAVARGETAVLVASTGDLPIGINGPTDGNRDGAAIAMLMSTTATFTPTDGVPVVTTLNGTQAQIANAAGFLGAAFASGLSPSQVTVFTTMALAGADYIDLIDLHNAVAGLLPPSPQPREAANISATQLDSAIRAYNNLVDNSDPATLLSLGENTDFVALGQSLQQLRTAIDAQPSNS